MHQADDIERDLEPGLDLSEREKLLETARHLHAMRPSLRPGFEASLQARVLLPPHRSQPEPSRRPVRPPSLFRVRVVATAYAVSGTLLLAIAALGLDGIGPFASS